MQLLSGEDRYKENLTQHYYFCANQTQKYWDRDNCAALKIQSIFRMFIKRKQFLTKKAAAIKIQTLFRAFYARKMFKIRKFKDQNKKNLQYFAKQAINIQRIFRGFYVRKYVHNFYLRKQQLKALETKNQQFRQELNKIAKLQASQTEQYKRQLAKVQFSALAKNLHHLASTKNIPGVYNSPFAVEMPSVFNKTVEEHLTDNFHDTYTCKGGKRENMVNVEGKVEKSKI